MKKIVRDKFDEFKSKYDPGSIEIAYKGARVQRIDRGLMSFNQAQDIFAAGWKAGEEEIAKRS